ncbi:MAG: hypothetical protein FADNKDHG_01565 [Holosporales bacterium]
MIKGYVFPVFYGFSLIFPYTREKPYYFAVGLPILYVLMLVGFWIISSMADPSYFVSVVLMLTAVLVIGCIKWYKYFEKMIFLLDKTRVEKLYRIKVREIDKDSEVFYRTAIEMHRKYGKYEEYQKCDRQNKLRYIEDQELIKECVLYNRKWMVISFLHVLVAVLFVYYMDGKK